ncbi:MAG TPA: hypothetical protein VFJ13_04170 [Paracoccaceae bacterium]|nr:hypothetical protein [Paracoccaceae bacterium]
MSTDTGKFSLNQLWKDVQAVVAARAGDFLLPAAAFVFLPSFAQGLFVAQPANPMQPDPAYTVSTLIAALIGLLGTLSIIAMTIDPRLGTAAAIRLALRRYGRALGTALITGAAIFIGLLALVLPGIYLLVRLWLVMPAVVMDDGEGLLGPLKASWRATEGAGVWLRSFAVFVIVIAAGLLLAIVASAAALIDPIIGSGNLDAGQLGLFGSLAAAIVSAVMGAYFAAAQARAYAALTGAADRRRETFA